MGSSSSFTKLEKNAANRSRGRDTYRNAVAPEEPMERGMASADKSHVTSRATNASRNSRMGSFLSFFASTAAMPARISTMVIQLEMLKDLNSFCIRSSTAAAFSSPSLASS